MSTTEAAGDKQMRLRYGGTCRLCGVALPERTEAIYERSTRSVRCVECVPSGHSAVEVVTEIDCGTPGASARREFERRQRKREDRIRTKHPKLGGLMLALSDDPQSTRAWDTGAIGEERLGNRLNELASDSLRVLHDRRMPRSTANIDHVVIAPTGVYVIDAKRYKGRPTLRVEGGLLRARVEKVMVAGRDRTKNVDGVLKQVDVIRTLVGEDVPIHGVLCFIEADWPVFGGSFTTRDVQVLWPRRLYPKLMAAGPLSIKAVAGLHRSLSRSLKPA